MYLKFKLVINLNLSKFKYNLDKFNHYCVI